ncbi:hypothetical protein [Algoriphagus sp. CAU 1675]|uniref:hypothetical protein n=1 Tax=Algoriphagus sp. CAU 1675 TaxID=3032597 RepID=UPI0023DCB9F6|nr:hypothetical protein [Algoriphagus sp. CAU 1675]MDF2157168.1 hypothetical protein [Algoriphagus sp. CAU 1675]
MKFLLILSFFFSYLASFGQQSLGKPITEIQLPNRDLVSFDTRDQFFVSTEEGDIYLFNPDGKELNFFSPTRQGKLSQLEASWTVNIFSFSADLQQYRVLDRFLNPLIEEDFMNLDVHLAKAATFGNNNILWVWDESDLSLKRLDYLRSLVLDSQPLNLILNDATLGVSEIREFKNQLFMNVPESGIYVFDNQGNLLQKIELSGIKRLNLYKNHLIWTESGKLTALDLRDQSKKILAPLPKENIDFVQFGQNRLVLAGKDTLYLYAMPDWIKAL